MPPKRSAPQSAVGADNGSPKKAKTQDKGTEVAAKHNEEYTWISCDDEKDDLKRLEIKEQARREAELHATKIEKALLPMLTSHVSDADEADSSGSGVEELTDWVTQLAKVRKNHDEFRVYIGVAGATGAGKTSALNAVLGYRDLLPCSCEGAATAAVCQVSYNNDDNPKNAFRAEVAFRSEADFKQELDLCLEDLKLKAQLEEQLRKDIDNSDDESTEERILASRDLEVVDENMDDTLGRILTIWNLDQEALRDESTESLLARNSDVLALLGRTICIADGESDSFSDKIKPYLDSSPADHGDTGLEFPAWPLIDEVRIYVKSDVLKHGVVLVDLPGLADNAESRAAVAQKYFSKLTVTAIITPIIRARNEQTGVQLMSDHQELMLKMDGKFHKKAFCVVLSKMDEIDAKAHLKRHADEAQADPVLQDFREKLSRLNLKWVEGNKELKSAENGLKALKKQFTAAEKALENAKSGDDNDAVNEAARQAQEIFDLGATSEHQIQKLKDSQISFRRLTKHFEGYVHYWCMQSRNRRVQEDIQQDFQQRQKRIAGKGQGDLYDGTVKIFTISSKAYWKVEEETEKPIGFPDLRYTGILDFRTWIRYATVAERERHLNMTLHAFHGLFNGMKTWSTNEWAEPLELAKDFIEKEVLHKPLQKLKSTLTPVFTQLNKDIRALNPLKSKQQMIRDNKDRCTHVVANWAMKKPDDSRSTEKIHWATYNACIARHGAPFRSGRPRKYRYAWIEKLSNLFYDGIVQEWNIAVNKHIPDLKTPVCEKIDVLWGVFLDRLEKRVKSTAPEMMVFLDSVRTSLESIKEEIKDKACTAITEISLGASRAHRRALKSIQDNWEPAFTKALKEKGRGKFERQRVILEKHARSARGRMFDTSVENVENKLKENMKQFRKDFQAVTAFALERVRGHIALLVDNAIQAKDGGEEAEKMLNRKQRAQRQTRKVIAEWAALWRIGDYVEATDLQRENAIPEKFDDGFDKKAEGWESDDELAIISFGGTVSDARQAGVVIKAEPEEE